MFKHLFFYVFIILLISDYDIVFAQKAQISGTVFIPVVRKERRTFRGRLYRNRLSSKKKIKKSNQTTTSSFVDIIVSVHPISFKPKVEPLENTRIYQKNAAFLPRVVPVTPGTVVEFINRDRFFHNVFSITKGSVFNIGRRPTGVVERRKINKLGEIKLFCDIHAQMNATILCLDTPYFTRVLSNGRYLISNLPEGKYEIRIYHPDFSEISEIIEIKEDQKIIRNYTISR